LRKSRIKALKKQFAYNTGHLPHGKREIGTTEDGYTAYIPSEKRRMKKEYLDG